MMPVLPKAVPARGALSDEVMSASARGETGNGTNNGATLIVRIQI